MRSNRASGDSIVFHPAMCLKRFDLFQRRNKPEMRFTTDREGGLAIPSRVECVKPQADKIGGRSPVDDRQIAAARATF